MRRDLHLVAVTIVLILAGWRAAEADTVRLTGGFVSAYLGDRGGAFLSGDGFSVDAIGSGGWPVSVQPGGMVDFSAPWNLSEWGNATINGTKLHGDPSGPGAGRLWISGSLLVVAKPFIAPPPRAFGGLSASVTITGTIVGYYNANRDQPPLFAVDVVGQGMVSGPYRYIHDSAGNFYLDNCCATLAISPLPQPWAYADIGAVGQTGSASPAYSFDSGEIFTVRSAGADIWGASDSFGYVYQPFNGDGWIEVDVLSLQNSHPFAKIGLMLRQSLDPSSANVIFDVLPNGQTEFMSRWSVGDSTRYLAGSTGPMPATLALYRHGSIVSAYVLGDGAPRKIADTSILLGQQLLVGVAVTSHDATTLTTATFRPPLVCDYAYGLPQGWSDADIGAVGRAGLTVYDGGVFTMRGSGADIWGSADSFHFLSQTMRRPDSQIVSRVTNLENTNAFAKSGIMMRLGREPSATDAFVVLDVRPTGDIEFMTRSSRGQPTTFIAAGYQQTPVWLKLAVSSGTTITGSFSTDGIQWTVLGSAEPNFAEMDAGDGWVSGGLVVTSHDTTKVNTATFDNVAITDGGDPTALPRFWANRDVGSTGRAGRATYDGGTFTVRGAGADIWGTIDAFQQVYQRFDNDPIEIEEYPVQHAQVTARVTSLTNTNTFAKAGIMIRDSEAPDSAHVILDVRPTGDVELMTRKSTGELTTYIGGMNVSLPVWLKLVRSDTVVWAYVSSDGTNWTLAGNAVSTLSPTTTQVGPVVTSHDPGALNIATFDHVEVRVPQ